MEMVGIGVLGTGAITFSNNVDEGVRKFWFKDISSAGWRDDGGNFRSDYWARDL